MTNFVYVIGPDPMIPGALVKIGTTGAVHRRLQTFQAGSPVPIAVLWAVPGDNTLEHWLHDLFADKRRHGEWFDLGQDPVRIIKDALGVHLDRVTESRLGTFPVRPGQMDTENEDTEDEDTEDEDTAPVLSLSAYARRLVGEGLSREDIRHRMRQVYGEDTSQDSIKKAVQRAVLG